MLPNAQPKLRPRLLDKREAAADARDVDRKQRDICKARSGGRCEVREVIPWITGSRKLQMRCPGRAGENHHLLGGIGRKNVGRSVLAAHRIQVCRACHKDITGHVLVPYGAERELAATIRYERRR